MTLSHRQVVTVGQQGTLGTPATPTMLLPVTSFSAEELFEQVIDSGRRGPDALDFKAVQGAELYNISIEGNIQADPGATLGFAIGILLRNIFATGALSKSNVTAPVVYVHDFQLGTTKDYLTFEVDSQITDNNRRFEACRLTSLSVKWNSGEGALTYSAEAIGRAVDIRTDAQLFDPSGQVATIEDPLMGYHANVGFNEAMNHETPASKRLISAEWTLSRSSKPLYVGQAGQSYLDLYLGPLECTVSMVFDYSVDTDLALLRAGSSVAIVNHFSNVAPGSTSTTGVRRFAIGGDKFSLLEAPGVIDSSGENLTLALSARGLYSEGTSPIIAHPNGQGWTSDIAADTMSGPVQVRLTSLRTSAY